MSTFSLVQAQISNIYFSQCSVATHLCCGGILSNSFIAHCPEILPANKNLKMREELTKLSIEFGVLIFGTQCSRPKQTV